MTTRFEIFAIGQAQPDEVWALVGNPRRLPEWTDVESVEQVDPEPVVVGSQLVVGHDGQIRSWEVTTFSPRLLEAVTALPRGRLGIGVRVLSDPIGSRVVLAGAFAPADRLSRLGFLLVGRPRLRRRFDQWSQQAVRERPGGA